MQIIPTQKQMQFLGSKADITIYGGAAGGGKTYALLLEPLKYITSKSKKYRCITLRRTMPEITKSGALWDEALDLYPLFGAVPRYMMRSFIFPNKAVVSFGAMQLEESKENYKGAQVTTILFDQLETFTESQFFYMFSRNRSGSNVQAKIKATANPEPNWLSDFLGWWIADDGYADMDRVGKMRFMFRDQFGIHWGDSRDKLVAEFGEDARDSKSVTFIPSTVYDNPFILENNPSYVASLKAMHHIDRERLLGDPIRGGNWKIKEEGGNVFNAGWFGLVEAAPVCSIYIRGWDFAATEKQLDKDDPDRSASCLIGFCDGIWYIIDVTNEALSGADAEKRMWNIAEQDIQFYKKPKNQYRLRWEQEGGSAGKKDSQRMMAAFAKFGDVKGVSVTGDKITRAKPMAVQLEAGNIKLVKGHWNKMFIDQLIAQPSSLVHDDMMDAASLAFNEFFEKKIKTGTATVQNRVRGSGNDKHEFDIGRIKEN